MRKRRGFQPAEYIAPPRIPPKGGSGASDAQPKVYEVELKILDNGAKSVAEQIREELAKMDVHYQYGVRVRSSDRSGDYWYDSFYSAHNACKRYGSIGVMIRRTIGKTEEFEV